MKRFLCLFIVLLTIGTSSLANGTEDTRNVIVKLPDDQLIALRDMVQQEINYRGLEGAFNPGTFSPWYDYGLGKILPNPEVYLGHLYVQYDDFVNTDAGFTETLGIMSSYEFEAYVDFLIKCGFTQNAYRFNGAFQGDNSDGVKVTAYLDDGKMSIMCTK